MKLWIKWVHNFYLSIKDISKTLILPDLKSGRNSEIYQAAIHEDSKVARRDNRKKKILTYFFGLHCTNNEVNVFLLILIILFLMKKYL